MLLTIIVILLVVALIGGGWGYGTYGWPSLSPVAVILIVLVVLYFTGHIR
jgi:hypothetical protein